MSSFRHVCLLYDIALSHTTELMKQFLKEEKVTFLPHPPYFPNLALCDFFLFPKISYLVVVKSPDKPLTRSSVSASEVYLTQHTVKHFRNGFRDWNYVFQTVENTLKESTDINNMLYMSLRKVMFLAHLS